MSRSIVVLATDERREALAEALARALSRRVVREPSEHPDDVVVIPAERLAEVDLDLACALAPEGDLPSVLGWAMDRGDVLTRWEHEQVMP